MKDILSQADETMKTFKEKSPEQMKAFHKTLASISKEGVLSKKHKGIIAVALSICQQCEWCIAFHVDNALKAGASEEEILEAAWVAVLMGGGPALMHAGLVLDALEELKE